MLELAWFVIFITAITVMLFAPYDEAIYHRRYIGTMYIVDDGDRNPYTSQSRCLDVERSTFSVYVGGFRRTLTLYERQLSDGDLLQLVRDTFN